MTMKDIAFGVKKALSSQTVLRKLQRAIYILDFCTTKFMCNVSKFYFTEIESKLQRLN